MTFRSASPATLLFTNLSNSLAAGALTASTWLLGGETIRPRILTCIVVLSFLCYSILRPPIPSTRKFTLFLFLVVLGYFVMDLYRTQPVSWNNQPRSLIYVLFALCGLLTVLYHPRAFLNHLKFQGLRSVPWIKNLTIGITWGSLTTLPIVFSSHSWEMRSAGMLVLARTLYVTGLSLLSDLGDRQIDRPHLHTGSIWLGERATKACAVMLAIVADILIWLGGWIPGAFVLPAIAVVFILHPQAKWRNELAIDASVFASLLLLYFFA